MSKISLKTQRCMQGYKKQYRKGKTKIHPKTGHEEPDGQQRYTECST